MALSGIGPSFAFDSYAQASALSRGGRKDAPARPGEAAAPDGSRLTPEQQQQVERLKAIDQKVRAHEQAHLAAAAGLAISPAQFQYVRGPDGRLYAVAGEVSIDVSPAQTPEATIDKARRIQAAALAPADPSPQDRAVAAAAAQMAAQAQAEKMRIEREEAQAQREARARAAETANVSEPSEAFAPSGERSNTPTNSRTESALRAYAAISATFNPAQARIDRYA